MKAAGGLAAWLLCGFLALASAQEKVRVFGDRYWHPEAPKEFVRTYVDMPKDHDGDTVPLAIGVQMTPGFIREADALPVTTNWTNKLGSDLYPGVAGDFTMVMHNQPLLHFPQVGRNPFPFAAFTYNYYGHPPLGVYDYQHFDLRFFMVQPDWWWGEQYPEGSDGGPCNEAQPDAFYRAEEPVPAACWPGDPETTVNQGHFWWGQGAHLYNMLEPGWAAFLQGSGVDDVNSMVWGMQDGQLAYIETMFSRTLALEPDVNDCIDFSSTLPKHFDTERSVPTRRCIMAGSAAIKIEYTNFVTVPGGCADMRNDTSELTGWFPQEILQVYYAPDCKVPVPP